MSGTLRLRGATSGYSELQAPAVAADQTFVLPTAGGTLLTTDSPVPKLTLELGSASQPSLTFEGDTDTGLYSSGTNTLNLVTGGSNRLVLDSAGRVGINTTSPSYVLDVNGTFRVVGESQFDADIYRGGDPQSGVAGTALFGGTITVRNSVGSNSVFRGQVVGSTDFKIDLRADGEAHFLGDVGVGTTTPQTKFSVSNSSSAPAFEVNPNLSSSVTLTAFDRSVANTWYDMRFRGDEFIFSPLGNEKIRIDTTGRLLVGTSTARANFLNSTFSAQLQVEGTGHSTSSFSLTRNANNNGSPYFNFAKSRGTSNGSNVIVQDNDKLGSISFQGSDGTEFVEAARIDGRVDGTPGANDMPGRLVFSTTADGASSPTERVRMDSDGRLLIGSSDPITTVSNGFNSSSYLSLAGDATAKANIGASYWNNNTTGASSLSLSKSRGTSIGTHVVLNSTDRIGSISFSGSDGTAFIEAARITGLVDGTPDTNDMPGRLAFSTTPDGLASPVERMTIDNSGDVGIGTDSPEDRLTVGDTSTGDQRICIFSTTTSNDDPYGNIVFRHAVANGNRNAKISALRSGGSSGADLAFYTRTQADGTNIDGGEERMRITSVGNVGIGTDSPGVELEVNGDIGIGRVAGSYTFRETVGGALRAGIHSDASNKLEFRVGANSFAAQFDGSGNFAFKNNDNNPVANNVVGIALRTSGNFISNTDTVNAPHQFRRNTDGDLVRFYRSSTTDVGAIRVNSSQTFFDTTSDHRLKENATAITDGITRVKQLQPKRFNFIIDPEVTVDGFFAHETQPIVPEAVDGTYNEVDDDNNPVYQSMDHSKLVPLLTAALQEAITKIETLEANNLSLENRIAALENN